MELEEYVLFQGGHHFKCKDSFIGCCCCGELCHYPFAKFWIFDLFIKHDYYYFLSSGDVYILVYFLGH
jgi:hypothetical protein